MMKLFLMFNDLLIHINISSKREKKINFSDRKEILMPT